MKIKGRKFLDKLFIFTLIFWVMLFVYFTTFCLRMKSHGSTVCQRALNTYSLVPVTFVVTRNLNSEKLENDALDAAFIVQNGHEENAIKQNNARTQLNDETLDKINTDELESSRNGNVFYENEKADNEPSDTVYKTEDVVDIIDETAEISDGTLDNFGESGDTLDERKEDLVETREVVGDIGEIVHAHANVTLKAASLDENNSVNTNITIDSLSDHKTEDGKPKTFSENGASDAKPYQYNSMVDIVNEFKQQKVEDKYGYYKLNKIKTKYDNKFLVFNAKQFINADVIIIVPSTTGNFKARDAIRKTYGSLSRDRKNVIAGLKINLTVRVLFVFGRTDSKADERQIMEEHLLHKDILLIDFVDSYYNLTRKMINSFSWVNEFCPSVSYAIKADDDVFINVPLLLGKIHELSNKSHDSLYGFVYGGVRHIRRTGRWGVPHEVYPFARYPQYISGTSYTISGHLLRPIVYYAAYFPYLHIEDAFITGVIGNMVLGARLEHLAQSSHYKDDVPNPCEFVSSRRLIQTKTDHDTMLAIWNAMLDYNKYCNSSSVEK